MTKGELNAWCAKYRGWQRIEPLGYNPRWMDGDRLVHDEDLPQVASDICEAVKFRHETGMEMDIYQYRNGSHMAYHVTVYHQGREYFTEDTSEAYATTLAIYKAVEDKS